MRIEIPKHLLDLIETRPSSYEKLNLVFHELSIENQILILKYKKNTEEEGHKEIAFLLEEFYLNAIKSKNPYIRYLVTENYSSWHGDSETSKKINNIIENDKNNLVKYSLLEKDWIWPSADYEKYYEINNFLKLSQPERLACVRKVTKSPEHIGTLFENLAKSVEKDKISEIEVAEILLEFSKNKELSADLLANPLNFGMKNIWGTVNSFKDNLSSLLVANLPISLTCPQEELVLNMSLSDIRELTGRKDYEATETRQKLFLKSLEKFQKNKDKDAEFDRFNYSYIYNFSLNEEIIEGLINLDKKGEAILRELDRFSENLTLAELMIVEEIKRNNEFEYSSYGAFKRGIYLDNKIAKFKKDKSNTRELYDVEVEVLRARIYQLSHSLVKGKITDDPQLKTYRKHIKENNVFKTYYEILSKTDIFFGHTRRELLESLSWAYSFPELDELIDTSKSK